MRRFFRESIIGILLISFLGSLLAAIVSPLVTSQQSSSGSVVRDLLLQPVPALTLLPYSLAILLVFAGYLYWQNRRHSKEVTSMRSESERELTHLRTQNKKLASQIVALGHQLGGRENLIRRIALVLADPPPTYQGYTVEDVLKRVITIEGNAATERDVAEAMATMFDARAIYKSATGFELVNDWRDRLQMIGFDISKNDNAKAHRSS
jgi:hypothetical protein